MIGANSFLIILLIVFELFAFYYNNHNMLSLFSAIHIHIPRIAVGKHPGKMRL